MSVGWIRFWQWVCVVMAVLVSGWVAWLLWDLYRPRRDPQPVSPVSDPIPKPQSPTGPSEAVYRPRPTPGESVYRQWQIRGGLRMPRR